jgi:hypothetical protein
MAARAQGRTLTALLLLLSLALALTVGTVYAATAPGVTLVLSFCTSVLDGKGAVVTVQSDASFKVIATFAWPAAVGNDCPSVVNDDVVSFIDESFAYLDFSSQWGLVLKVDLRSGSIVSTVKPKSSTIFDGFVEFDSFSPAILTGLAGHVEPKGHYCEDGCFSLGHMDLSTGEYRLAADVPYKSVMTASHLVDLRRGLFYTQASYPLTPDASCASDSAQLCFVTIDASSGQLLNATGPNAYVAYAYMPLPADKATALVWAHDCLSTAAAAAARPRAAPDCNFAFLHVDIASSSIVANISRVPPAVVVHTTPEKSVFSADGAFLAQASGNAYTGALQLLVFDVATGEALVNSAIPGLKQALGVADESPFISVRRAPLLRPDLASCVMCCRCGPSQWREATLAAAVLEGFRACKFKRCCCRDSNGFAEVRQSLISFVVRILQTDPLASHPGFRCFLAIVCHFSPDRWLIKDNALLNEHVVG